MSNADDPYAASYEVDDASAHGGRQIGLTILLAGLVCCLLAILLSEAARPSVAQASASKPSDLVAQEEVLETYQYEETPL